MLETGGALLERASEQLDDTEARSTLSGMAHERFGAIPAEVLADRVLGLDARADWPVRREAMEALRRRWEFGERDRLRVAQRPAGSVLGEYATRAKGRKTRPYRTVLEGVDPLRGSCGCSDFRRGSLGLCKHLLVVLDDVASRKGAWQRAARGMLRPGRARLAWNPLQPLLGASDWLERVRLVPALGRKARLPAVAQSFTPGVGAELVLKSTLAGRPERRIELVRALLRFAQGGDPALQARLEEELAELERVVGLQRSSRRLEGHLRGLKRKLYPYQLVGVQRYLARGRLLLADDMGLGKTVQAVAACQALFGAKLVERGLLVVPAPLKHQWLREWQATSAAPVQIVEGSRDEREKLYASTRRGFLIGNYEQLLRDLDLVRAWDPGIVVLDEAQRIKNWEAKTSHAVKSLRPTYRLVLTGTPMENRLDELASIVEWVDDHALEPKWRLAPLHSQRADGERAIVGARHLDTLRARLAPCSLRRVRREVLDQLPGRTDTTIPIDMTGAQREAHDDLERPIASLLRILASRPLTQPEFLKLMRLLTIQRQVCNGLCLVDFEEIWPTVSRRKPTERVISTLDAPKLGELRTLVESLVVDQERKVVVFSQWRRMLQLAAWVVSDLLEAAGARAVFFSGQEAPKRRTQNIVDFHDDPATRMLLATDAGGVGLNLQRAASVCILLELPWNPAVLEQRVGRIHRLGQTEPVEVYSILARGGIEEHIAGLVADKRALFRGIFDGESDAVLFDRSGSFLEELRRTVDRPSGPPDDEEVDDDQLEGGDGLADEAFENADEPPRAPGIPEPVQVGSMTAGSPHELLAGLRVERTPEGLIRIEAPPESADVLIALFEGLAGALRSSRAGPGRAS